MRRTPSAGLRLIVLLAAASALRADFDPALWRVRRKIAPQGGLGIARIQPDAALYRGSLAGLADLRVVYKGVDVPYRIDTLRGANELREVQATILNRAAIPGTGVQLTLETMADSRHDRVRIVTPLQDFRRRVRIETSDDQKNWAVARSDGSIFDVSAADRPASDLTVTYPVSTRRYVRVTVFGWTDAKAITSAWLSHYDQRPERRAAVAVNEHPKLEADAAAQATLITWDLGSRGTPHDTVHFDVGPGAFSRSVEVESSVDGKQWMPVGGGTISRDALFVAFSEQWARYLRVRVLNRDDRPLPIQRLRLESLVRYFLFRAEGPGPYWLYYGYAGARAPSYDLAGIGGDTRSPAELGDEEPNPDYKVPATPVSERNPTLLYGVLVAAIVGMGYLTLRFLKTVKANT